MAVTYLYDIDYNRGSAEYTDTLPPGTLWRAVLYARCNPGHRIEIEAHEHPTDPLEVGAARRRLEALRRHLVANSIEEQRIEMRTHGENCWCKRHPDEMARRAEIRLFPRVANLCHDMGDPLLSPLEVSVLESARGATFGDVEANCRDLERRYPEIEWKRILGHESLRNWIEPVRTIHILNPLA